MIGFYKQVKVFKKYNVMSIVFCRGKLKPSASCRSINALTFHPTMDLTELKWVLH
jgi:hypothetical protein